MHGLRRSRVIFLFASTALSALPLVRAHAQSSAQTSPINLDLGTVTATGSDYANGGAAVAPSSTGSQKQAVKEQKLAPNIVYVQPESVMQKLPDSNVAENLKHVPGVSTATDSGFSRYVMVRGLSEDLNSTRYAGLELPGTNTNASPTGGGRAVALDFLPPGIIGGAKVIPTLTPDIAATGLGGVIDLLPPSMPADKDTMLDVNAGGGTTLLQHNAMGQVSLTAGMRFAIPGLKFENAKPFTVLGSFGYINTSPGIFDMEEGYTNGTTTAGMPAQINNLQLRRYNNQRISKGYTGEIDFDPNPQTHLYVLGMFSSMNETIQKDELYLQNLDASSIDNGNNNFTATGANLNKYYENSSETDGMTVLKTGGNFMVANLVNVTFHSGYAEGFDRFNHDFVSNFGSNDQNLIINYDTSNRNFRSYSIATASGAAYDPTNPNNYTFSDLTNLPISATDRIYDNGASFAVPTSFLNTLGTFKVGADFSLRSRNSMASTISYTPVNGGYSLASVTGGMPSLTTYGRYPLGPNLNYGQLFGQGYTASADPVSAAQSYQHDRENIYAGFAQEDLQWNKLEVLAGLRFEATDAAYSGYASTTDANGNTTIGGLDTKSQSYNNIFPTVQLKYDFTPELQGRFAYSTGIARPGFQQVSPAISTTANAALGSGSGSLISTGNPNLKPQTGKTFDVALAYYTHNDGVYMVDGFLKNIDNYIIATNYNANGNTYQTFKNISGAQVRGVQLEAIQRFYFLPHPLDGLGIDANLTYVDGTGKIFPGQGRSILPETYPLTANIAETYKKGRFDFEISENYTSRNLFAAGSNPGSSTYTQPTFMLDVSASYQLTPHWTFYAQGANLTNYRLYITQGSNRFYPIQREYYGQRLLFGVHYHF